MSWREKLPELEGFALLPCGAGDKGKAPIDQVTGKHLNNWPDASFTPDDILAMTFAWSLFYGTCSYLKSNFFLHNQGMIMQVRHA